MRVIFVLFLLLATPIWAEVPYPKYSQLGSNLGALIVKQTASGEQQLFINDLEIGGVRAAQVYLHGVFNHRGDASQSALLSLRFAKAGCFDSWLVIRIAGNRVMPFAPFGGCAEIPLSVEVDALGIKLMFSHPDPKIAAISHRYDGQGFVNKVVRPSNDEGSGDGPLPELDWQKWVGRDSVQFLQDPIERFRFMYVGTEEWKTLMQQTQVSGALFSDGKYLYGYGCSANPCQSPHVVFSISIDYGYPRYVFHDKNGQRKNGGDILSRFPEIVRQFYYTGVFNR